MEGLGYFDTSDNELLKNKKNENRKMGIDMFLYVLID
jgi:hypothetical protein